MKQSELITKYVNESQEKKERTLGRYYASEIWGILNGKVKPEDFFKHEDKDELSSAHIFRGLLTEEGQKKLFDFSKIDYLYQEKKEISIQDFVIVAKPDFIVRNEYILEMKAPAQWEGIKDYHRPQLECYYRAFNLPVRILYIGNWVRHSTYEYIPSDQLWDEIKYKLSKFHEKIKNLKVEK